MIFLKPLPRKAAVQDLARKTFPQLSRKGEIVYAAEKKLSWQ